MYTESQNTIIKLCESKVAEFNSDEVLNLNGYLKAILRVWPESEKVHITISVDARFPSTLSKYFDLVVGKKGSVSGTLNGSRLPKMFLSNFSIEL